MSPTPILTFILFFAAIALLWLFDKLLEARKRARRIENAHHFAQAKPAELAAHAPATTEDSEPELDLTNLPYLRRTALLRPGERAFLPTLQQACADRSLIFTQVQLSKLIYPRSGIARWQSYQNKIDRKSVDFVLCHPTSLVPQLIIELDDKSHTREDRQQRDDFVNRALNAAGIPLLRIPAASSYSAAALEQQIRGKVHAAKGPVN
ncbi:MAG: DUF2726 domain-containing protein [Phycisphaerae bacterium]|nr:DUF2726 domain-containing protein [Phycisphaerae bacterium]